MFDLEEIQRWNAQMQGETPGSKTDLKVRSKVPLVFLLSSSQKCVSCVRESHPGGSGVELKSPKRSELLVVMRGQL